MRTAPTSRARRSAASLARRTNLGYRAASWGALAIALIVADYVGWRAAFFDARAS